MKLKEKGNVKYKNEIHEVANKGKRMNLIFI